VIGAGLRHQALQLGPQLGSGRVALFGLALEQLVDQRPETVREGGPQLLEVGWISVEPGERGVAVGLPEEGHPPGEALVEHEAQGVEIGPAVEPSSAHLLG